MSMQPDARRCAYCRLTRTSVRFSPDHATRLCEDCRISEPVPDWALQFPVPYDPDDTKDPWEGK